MAAEKLRVILADDHELLRAGFSAALIEHDIEVVGTTGVAEEVLDRYEHCRPDVVVLDILFQGRQTGLNVIRRLMEDHPLARVVVLSQFDQDSLIKEAYNAGALAFVPKASDTNHLVEAIRKAACGQIYFIPEISDRLALMTARPERSPTEVLSKRELETFILLANGRKMEEIASELGITTRTVANLSQLIKKKLGVSRGTELTLLAVRYKIIQV